MPSRRPIPENSFYCYRLESTLSRKQVADFFGRSVRTIQRWENGVAPEWAIRMMRLRAGYLDEFGPAWQDWRIWWGKTLRGRGWRDAMLPGELTFAVAMPETYLATYDYRTTQEALIRDKITARRSDLNVVPFPILKKQRKGEN